MELIIIIKFQCWQGGRWTGLAGQMTYIWGQQFDPPFSPLLRHNRAELTGLCWVTAGPSTDLVQKVEMVWSVNCKLDVTGHSGVWRLQFCCWENYHLSKWDRERLSRVAPSSEILSEEQIWPGLSLTVPDCLILLSFLSTLHCPYLVATIAELERCRNIDTMHSPPPTPQPPPPPPDQQPREPRDRR